MTKKEIREWFIESSTNFLQVGLNTSSNDDRVAVSKVLYVHGGQSSEYFFALQNMCIQRGDLA